MDTIWSPDLIDRLVALWDEGVPTAEIGRRLATSKNSVIGKVHRLALKPRASPLKRPPVRRRVLAPQPAVCAWPLGHPGDKDFHFCGGQLVPGKPYCAKHAAMAYLADRTRTAA